MIGGKTVLAVVPARGGSKRLPGKNLRLLDGVPLISWSIRAAQQSKYVDAVLVTSDSPAILAEAEKHSAPTIVRPAELATDEATSMSAIVHALAHSPAHDLIVLLQPTSPLRGAVHVDAALESTIERGARAVISVCPVEHSPLWSNTLPADGAMDAFLRPELKNVRSQELAPYYRLNGAIYICEMQALLDEQTFMLSSGAYAFQMDRRSSVDIDDEDDFALAEFYLAQGRR